MERQLSPPHYRAKQFKRTRTRVHTYLGTLSSCCTGATVLRSGAEGSDTSVKLRGKVEVQIIAATAPLVRAYSDGHGDVVPAWHGMHTAQGFFEPWKVRAFPAGPALSVGHRAWGKPWTHGASLFFLVFGGQMSGRWREGTARHWALIRRCEVVNPHNGSAVKDAAIRSAWRKEIVNSVQQSVQYCRWEALQAS
jgi:hypothetical protein